MKQCFAGSSECLKVIEASYGLLLMWLRKSTCACKWQAGQCHDQAVRKSVRIGGKVATESPWDLLRVLLRLQVPDLPSRSFLAAKAIRGISLAAGLVSSPLLRVVNIPRQRQGEISSGSSHKRNRSYKLAERCLGNRPAIKYKNKFHADQRGS